MKKIILIGTAALGMFFMTTSCLENVEPAGIEAMRQAKAELISAQAAYKAAETAYLTAQQALVDVEVAKKEIENQMMEIDLQSKQLALDLQQAQNEHEIRMLELEYLRQQAEDEARQKELESQISYWEYVIAKNQMDTQLLDLEREVALEKHNARMIELQARTAEAEYELEMALRNLEALKAGLTETETNQLNALIAIVDAQRQELNAAQDALIEADRALIDAQYTYTADSTYWYNRYALEVASWERTLELAQKDLAEVPALAEEGSWATQKQDAINERSALVDQIIDLQSQAKMMESEKNPFIEKQNELSLQIDALSREINDLNEQVTGSESALDARATFEIEVPASIVPYVGATFESTFVDQSNQTEDTDALVVISGFKVDAATGEYTLPDGKFVYETSYRTAQDRLVSLSQQITVLTAPQITTLENALADAEKAYNDEINGTKTLYDFYTGIFEKGLDEYNAIAAVYGITDRELNRENLWLSAAKAYNDLMVIPADATDADIKELLDVIAQEQMLRDSLDGQNMIDYRTFTVDNYKAGTLDISLLGSYYASQPSIFTGYDISYSINPESTEAEINDYSAMELWCTASDKLYALDYLTEALTLTDVGYGEVFTLDYSSDIDNPYVSMKAIDNAGYNDWLTRMGYVDEYDFQASLLYRELADRELMSYIESQITNNADYSALATAIKTDIADIEALSETDDETNKALYAQMRDLYEQMDSLSKEIQIIEKSKDSVQFEIDKICPDTWLYTTPDKDNYYYTYPVPDTDYSQIAVLFRDLNRLTERIQLLGNFINAEEDSYYYMYVDGVDYSYDFYNMEVTIYQNGVDPTTIDFTVEDFVEVYTVYKQLPVENAQYYLSLAQERLARLELNGEPLDQIIEDLTLALERAQAAYNEQLEIYTIWSSRLNALLDLFAGNTEETPEA
ncbi:putative uncharacterized protein [Alistipes sp. CAG:831]|nr:putative uncharacterized protein [Alistipes sp. CAG:831]